MAEVMTSEQRLESGRLGYVVFLIVHVFFSLGLLLEHQGVDQPLEIMLHVIAAALQVVLLGAYTFAVRHITFEWTLSLTLTWLALAAGWFFSRGIPPPVYVLLFFVYFWLYLSGLLLKRGAIRMPSHGRT